MARQVILLVDHQAALLDTVGKILTAKGYARECARSAQEAMDLARKLKPTLLIINPVLPVLSGVEAAKRIAVGNGCKVLFLTDMAKDPDFREALRGLSGQGLD